MDDTLTPSRADPEPASPEGLETEAPGSPTRRWDPWSSSRPESRAFFGWAAAIYGVVTGIILAASLRITDGRLIYALDDPAIHLSIARTLAQDGTWGVTPGEFQSASSSPLWTIILAMGVAILPAGEELLPLVLNILASLAVLAVLARVQTVLRPSRHRPLDVLATAVLTVAVLFLPGATLVGMEHILHLALLLLAVHLLLRPDVERPRWQRLAPYLLIALATLTRLETAFVAAGLGLAYLLEAVPWGRDGPPPPRSQTVRRVVGLGLASGLPLVGYALVNRAMGQDWLPNSVVAKSDSLNQSDRIPALREVMERLTVDPVLSLAVASCVVLAALGWRARRPWAIPATAVAVAGALHVTVAQVGWYERYQLYLIGLAVYVGFRAAADIPRPVLASRPRLAPLLVLVLLLFTSVKVSLTVEAPRAVADTYQQRYQAAVFLDRYYDGEAVATGELGYISLLHDGPLTDLFGLADFEVLEGRKTIGPREQRQAFFAQLARDRGFKVAAVYPSTLLFDTPPEWILVGTWTLPREEFTAFDREFQFWATVPEEVAPLTEHLLEFQPEMPDDVELEINELAGLRAAAMEAEGPP